MTENVTLTAGMVLYRDELDGGHIGGLSHEAFTEAQVIDTLIAQMERLGFGRLEAAGFAGNRQAGVLEIEHLDYVDEQTPVAYARYQVALSRPG